MSDIVKCGICGMGMSYMDKKLSNGEIVTYVRNYWYKDSVGNKCKNRLIRSDIVIDEINYHIDKEIERLNELIENNSIDKTEVNKIENELSVSIRSLDKLNTKRKNILHMIEEGLYTIVEGKAKINDLQEEITYLQSNINKLNKEKAIHSTNQLEIKRDKIISIKEVIDTIESKSEINRLYKTILKKVEYIRDDNNVEIKVEFL